MEPFSCCCILSVFLFVGGRALGVFAPKCPRCKTRLSVSSRTLVPATHDAPGRGEHTYHCARCGHHSVEVYTISRRRRHRPHRHSTHRRRGRRW